MLQNLRDNLKGTVAVIVLIIFIVPLVLFGVEQLFVGSMSGTGAASVNGEEISQRELQRQLVLEKQSRQQRFDLEPGSPQLEDSVLMAPVLQRMTRRLALEQVAKDGGMGADTDTLWKNIAQIEAFQVDGKFDRDLFKQRISYLYTASAFLEASASDMILGHINAGIGASSFVTDSEVSVISAISQQKRSYHNITIPSPSTEGIEVTDADIEAYYQEHSSNFIAPETVTVDYIKLTLADLASSVEVPDADVKAAYDLEVSEFIADPKFKVAHILLKNEQGREARIEELSKKLKDGNFTDLAKEYSEDLGSKERGGDLGEMIADAYPDEFVEAVSTLSVGEVSSAVETDAGIHFIKLLDKTNVEAPSFEERKDSIERQLSLDLARESYAQKLETMAEATFGADSLNAAADQMSLEVKTSWPFGRNGTSDIAQSADVAIAAYGDDVLLEGHNSRVLELPNDEAVVLRLNSHTPEAVKPLALVKNEIKATLLEKQKQEIMERKSEELMAKLGQSDDPEAVAKELSYEYVKREAVTRSSADADPMLLRKVFSMARPAEGLPMTYETVKTPAGVSLIGLYNVEDGKPSDVEDAQLSAMKQQLGYQIGQVEMAAFEASVVARAKIELPDLQ